MPRTGGAPEATQSLCFPPSLTQRTSGRGRPEAEGPRCDLRHLVPAWPRAPAHAVLHPRLPERPPAKLQRGSASPSSHISALGIGGGGKNPGRQGRPCCCHAVTTTYYPGSQRYQCRQEAPHKYGRHPVSPSGPQGCPWSVSPPPCLSPHPWAGGTLSPPPQLVRVPTAIRFYGRCSQGYQDGSRAAGQALKSPHSLLVLPATRSISPSSPALMLFSSL